MGIVLGCVTRQPETSKESELQTLDREKLPIQLDSSSEPEEIFLHFYLATGEHCLF